MGQIQRHFSDREDQILGLIALGCSDKEVAARLCISKRTVATHLRRIFDKRGLGGARQRWWIGSR